MLEQTMLSENRTPKLDNFQEGCGIPRPLTDETRRLVASRKSTPSISTYTERQLEIEREDSYRNDMRGVSDAFFHNRVAIDPETRKELSNYRGGMIHSKTNPLESFLAKLGFWKHKEKKKRVKTSDFYEPMNKKVAPEYQ